MARPLRRVGLAQEPAELARREPGAHAPRLCRHLLQPPARPRDAARRDDGSPRNRRHERQGALRRHLELRRAADARGPPHPRRDGHPAAHPPAPLQHVRSAHGERPAGCSRRARAGQHRLLPARARAAHRTVSRRHPRRLARRRGPLDQRRQHRRGLPGPSARAQRHRRGARTVARAARPAVGAAPPPGDERAHRREQRAAARQQPRRPPRPRVDRRRAKRRSPWRPA